MSMGTGQDLQGRRSLSCAQRSPCSDGSGLLRADLEVCGVLMPLKVEVIVRGRLGPNAGGPDARHHGLVVPRNQDGQVVSRKASGGGWVDAGCPLEATTRPP